MAQSIEARSSNILDALLDLAKKRDKLFRALGTRTYNMLVSMLPKTEEGEV